MTLGLEGKYLLKTRKGYLNFLELQDGIQKRYFCTHQGAIQGLCRFDIFFFILYLYLEPRVNNLLCVCSH